MQKIIDEIMQGGMVTIHAKSENDDQINSLSRKLKDLRPALTVNPNTTCGNDNVSHLTVQVTLQSNKETVMSKLRSILEEYTSIIIQ